MKISAFIVSSILMLGIIGCSPEAQRSAEDAKAKAAEGVDVAGDAAANALMTGKIRTALTTATDLKVEDLDVDTVGKKITLKGKADAKNKTRAGDIARNQAGDEYEIVNEIESP